MRLAVIVTHPIQYFAPIFRYLAQQPNLDLKVFFGCNHGLVPTQDPNFKVVFKWDSKPTEGFDHEFLSIGSIQDLRGFAGIRLATKAVTSVNRFRPDCILIFSYSPTFITASTIFLRLAGHKLMLRAETTDEALTRSYLKDKMRQILLTIYYRQFTHFFPIGTNSMNHYRRMGVDKSRLTLVQYAIDVDFFQKQVDFWLPQREELRAMAGIKPDDHVLIYCGKMFQAKNPLLISDAIAMLAPEQKQKLWLLAVGDGELKQQFQTTAKAQLGERAVFLGFKNQSELGQYYAMADTLVLPSQSGETWGLVVNEALQFGLRVIVSDKVGSGRDLVANRTIGEIFPSGDTSKLLRAISQAIVQDKQPKSRLCEFPHSKQLSLSISSVTQQL